ncbi:MAG: 3-isopropylmalate dehydrogenase [Anaerolineales bacterium]|nr:3-isopropylmalate dehydrogenase [Anaerolineales bacterium]
MTQKKVYTVAVLPGDGIGVEVTNEAIKVLQSLSKIYDCQFMLKYGLVGGAAMEATGEPLPASTLELCRSAQAVLMGAVGDPKFDDPQAEKRPEQALLGLRKELGLFANLRPIKIYPALVDSTPIRPELVNGTDLVVVRELTGGIYFGQPRVEGAEQAFDTMVYSREEVERIAHVAFRIARERKKKVTSVDKANVLASSRLWRKTVTAVGAEYNDVQLEHMYVDAATMHLIRRPRDFDVILTSNMFGDILSDESSVLAGSMGMLPSASLSTWVEGSNNGNYQKGLYEPIHGSAPDIAGQGIANPLASILSVAMMLRHSLKLEKEAEAIEVAVANVLDMGFRTADIVQPGETQMCTETMGDMVVRALEANFETDRAEVDVFAQVMV